MDFTPASDPQLHSVLATPTRSARRRQREAAMSHASLTSSSSPSDHLPTQSPTDLLLATPPQLASLFVALEPLLDALLTITNLVLWKPATVKQSFLLTLVWAALCLSGPLAFTYGGPIVVALAFVARHLTAKPSSSVTTRPTATAARQLTPAAYVVLLRTARDLTAALSTLHAAFVQPAAKWAYTAPLPARLRALAGIYPSYVLIMHFVPHRWVVLVFGEFVILYHAPWVRSAARLLSKSALLRWGARCVRAVVLLQFGAVKAEFQGLKSRRRRGTTRGVKKVDVKEVEAAGETKGTEVLFTVFENQRWWVGLDWTMALLPGERPSWTDPELNASSPPSSFVLPPDNVVHLPLPPSKPGSKPPKTPVKRMKRISGWRWIDQEWKVLLTTGADGTTATRGMPLPSPSGLPSGAGGAAAPLPGGTTPVIPGMGDRRLSLASLGLAKGNSAPPSPVVAGAAAAAAPTLPAASGSSARTASPDSSLPGAPSSSNAYETDVEGWQYGDNHFEKLGPKAGLGRYTRRRAWVRRAKWVERVEDESEEDAEEGALRASRSRPKSSSSSSATTRDAEKKKE